MLEMVRITAARPESNACDVEFMADGRRVSGVQVVGGCAGTDFGSSGLTGPQVEGYGQANNGARDVYGVVGFMGNHPVILGFVYPQVAQMLFAGNRKTYRHPSDVYVTIDDNGNTELAHPSGAYVRIGEAPAHEDLTGQDADGIWKITKNTGRAVHIHIEQAGGVGSINIAPDGAIVNKSAVSITNEAPQLIFKGQVTQTGGTSSLVGPVTVTNDLVASGKSMVGHTHTSSAPGNPTSPTN
jgi:hypothetical protein